MTAKEYLGQAFRLDQRINSKLSVLSSLKDMATRTTGMIGDETVSHTRNGSCIKLSRVAQKT